MPKYDIDVQLLGQDGNVFNLIGLVKKALRKHKVPQEEMDLFTEEVTSGDYSHALGVMMQWVNVE